MNNKEPHYSVDYWIRLFLTQMPQLTKDQADFIAEIIKWDNDKKSGFILAKRLFEENDNDEE